MTAVLSSVLQIVVVKDCAERVRVTASQDLEELIVHYQNQRKLKVHV
jgi:hypothetical protein